MNRINRSFISPAIAWTVFAFGVGIGLTGKAYAEKHGAGNSAEIMLCYDRPFIERVLENGKVIRVPDPFSKIVRTHGLMDLWEGSEKSLYRLSSELVRIQKAPIEFIRDAFLKRLALREPDTAIRLEKTLNRIEKERKFTDDSELERLFDSNLVGIRPAQDLGNYCYAQQLVFQFRNPEPLHARFLIHRDRYEKHLPNNLHRFLTLVHEALILWENEANRGKVDELNRRLDQLERELPTLLFPIHVSQHEREIKRIEAELEKIVTGASDRIRPYLYILSSQFFDEATPEQYFSFLYEKGRVTGAMRYRFSKYPTIQIGRVYSGTHESGKEFPIYGTFEQPVEFQLTGNQFTTRFAKGAEVVIKVTVGENLSPETPAVKLQSVNGDLAEKAFLYEGRGVSVRVQADHASFESPDWIQKEGEPTSSISFISTRKLEAKSAQSSIDFSNSGAGENLTLQFSETDGFEFSIRGESPARSLLKVVSPSLKAAFESKKVWIEGELRKAEAKLTLTKDYGGAESAEGKVNGVSFYKGAHDSGSYVFSGWLKEGEITTEYPNGKYFGGFSLSHMKISGTKKSADYLNFENKSVGSSGNEGFLFEVGPDGLISISSPSAEGTLDLSSVELPDFIESNYNFKRLGAKFDQKGVLRQLDFLTSESTRKIRVKTLQGTKVIRSARKMKLRLTADSLGRIVDVVEI
jgi:hypothetical protein